MNKIQRITAQHFFQLGCIPLDQLNMYIREFLIELGDQRRYHICGKQRTCSYCKIPRLQTRQVIDVILYPLFDLGDFLRCLNIYFSDLCKLERCCTSVK